jgi:hypothetical protein
MDVTCVNDYQTAFLAVGELSTELIQFLEVAICDKV